MIINRSFYNRHTVCVAQDLLGCVLIRKYRGKLMKVLITETEAYRGEHDLASHASHGRTSRTERMYGEPGMAYVYLIYGMYHMFNIVTEEKDYPAAVLIRAGENLRGDSIEWTKALDGPGKLTKYLHIGKSFDGYDLTRGEKLWIEYPQSKHRMIGRKIVRSKRVGIDYARHCKEWKWNFKLMIGN